VLTHVRTSIRLVGDGAGAHWDPARGLGGRLERLLLRLSLRTIPNADDPYGRYAVRPPTRSYKLVGGGFVRQLRLRESPRFSVQARTIAVQSDDLGGQSTT
jgi:hypothetical protein